MSNHFPEAPSLADRLQAKIRRDQTEIGMLIQNELEELAKNMKDASHSVLNSTERDLQRHAKETAATVLRELETIPKDLHKFKLIIEKSATDMAATMRTNETRLKKLLLWLPASAIATTMVLSVGLSIWVSHLAAVQVDLTAQINRERLTAEKIGTAGISFLTTESGHFLVLPNTAEGNWKCGEAACIRLREK
jgi:hypothetical protein